VFNVLIGIFSSQTRFVLLVKVVGITFDLAIISLKIKLILTVLIQMETKLLKIDFFLILLEN
jgi:hypothetical protein